MKLVSVLFSLGISVASSASLSCQNHDTWTLSDAKLAQNDSRMISGFDSSTSTMWLVGGRLCSSCVSSIDTEETNTTFNIISTPQSVQTYTDLSADEDDEECDNLSEYDNFNLNSDNGIVINGSIYYITNYGDVNRFDLDTNTLYKSFTTIPFEQLTRNLTEFTSFEIDYQVADYVNRSLWYDINKTISYNSTDPLYKRSFVYGGCMTSNLIDKLYVVDGFTNYNEKKGDTGNNVFIYDFITDEWSVGAQLNYGRWIPYCVINNFHNDTSYLYVIGGRRDTNVTERISLDAIENRYNSWEIVNILDDSPEEDYGDNCSISTISYANAVNYENLIFVVGGYCDSTASSVNTVYCIDLEDNTVNRMNNKQNYTFDSRYHMSSFAVNNRLYVLGGRGPLSLKNESGNITVGIEYYDDIWFTNDLTVIPPSSPPTEIPSGLPSETPSELPSNDPSITPSSDPSNQPSNQPSSSPSGLPSTDPSSQPSNQPSTVPTPGTTVAVTQGVTEDNNVVESTETVEEVDTTQEAVVESTDTAEEVDTEEPTVVPSNEPTMKILSTSVDSTEAPTTEIVPETSDNGIGISIETVTVTIEIEFVGDVSFECTDENIEYIATLAVAAVYSLIGLESASEASVVFEGIDNCETIELSITFDGDALETLFTVLSIDTSGLSITADDVSAIIIDSIDTDSLGEEINELDEDSLLADDNVGVAVQVDVVTTDESTSDGGKDDNDNMMMLIIIGAGVLGLLAICIIGFFICKKRKDEGPPPKIEAAASNSIGMSVDMTGGSPTNGAIDFATDGGSPTNEVQLMEIPNTGALDTQPNIAGALQTMNMTKGGDEDSIESGVYGGGNTAGGVVNGNGTVGGNGVAVVPVPVDGIQQTGSGGGEDGDTESEDNDDEVSQVNDEGIGNVTTPQTPDSPDGQFVE